MASNREESGTASTALGPNPVIPGFAPDPSVCLIGDTFFLVNSSFHIFPGLPIYASKDLIEWQHIGNAINRPEQLSLRYADTKIVPLETEESMLATGGLYAPTIRHRSGVTYIICTNIVHDYDGPRKEHSENFIIQTTDIWSGEWSDPAYYDFRGIDPSILFDDDGKVYVQGSKTPDFQIYNFEIDLSTGKLLSEAKLIWTGWDKRWTEGPHLYKKDGWYYLLCAEGGTFQHHMVSMARSKSVWGPYEAYEGNPIWTAYGTDSYVQHTGHADLFQDAQGAWHIVMLAVRSRDQRYTMGRESFLASVEWPEGGWPSVRPGPADGGRGQARIPSCPSDSVDWVYLRDVHLSSYAIRGRDVSVRASKCDLTEPNETVSFIGKRQRRLQGSCDVRIASVAGLLGRKVRAGLALYKDEHRFVSIGLDGERKTVTLRGLNKAKDFSTGAEHAFGGDGLTLRIKYTETGYSFGFLAPDDDENETPLGTVDTLMVTGHDFTGPLLGMYCIGDEDVIVQFQDFKID